MTVQSLFYCSIKSSGISASPYKKKELYAAVDIYATATRAVDKILNNFLLNFINSLLSLNGLFNNVILKVMTSYMNKIITKY